MKQLGRMVALAFLLLWALVSFLSPSHALPSSSLASAYSGPLASDADPFTPPQPHEQSSAPRTRNQGSQTLGDPITNPVRDPAAREEGERAEAEAESIITINGQEMVRTLVHLDKRPLAAVAASMNADQRRAYAAEIAAAQAEVAAGIEANGGVVVARLTHLSTAIIAHLPPASADEVVALAQVERISLLHDYPLALSESVPAIGASELHTLGVTGEGIVIAIIDSGVDFTHRAFCPSGGTIAAFEAAYATHDQAPTGNPCFGAGAKVIGGYDFVGENWPGTLLPDPNPIDIQGHGTHVADIAAGLGYGAGSNADGPYAAKGAGVAPGASIWALKACSAFVSSCNGEAMLQALDAAADMDGNVETIDPVDVVNMSIGSKYGQPEDDAIALVNALAEMGVFVVISAGNDGSIPYIVSQPSIGDGAISVAQSNAPSYGRYPLQVLAPASISGLLTTGVWQPWSINPVVSGTLVGPLIYGDGDETNELGCGEYDNSLVGKIVLVDRGECDFTLKATNASTRGASILLIAMDDPKPPFEGTDAFHRPISMPVFMISQAEGDRLRAGLAEVEGSGDVIIELDPSLFIPLPKTMVDTSARGPAINDNRIKPEISAPGTSVSAHAGQGSESVPFGGTSGAAPMIAGSAALLLEQHGGTLAPYALKALLMNNADPNLHMVDAQSGLEGDLAPIMRMGSGEVDVAAAYSATLLAWDSTHADPVAWGGGISFGYQPVAANTLLTRTITLQNLRNVAVNVNLAAAFRYADDSNAGVQITPQPSALTLPANGTGEVKIVLGLYPQGIPSILGPLKPWQINKGEHGNDNALFTEQEVDGFIILTPTLVTPFSAPMAENGGEDGTAIRLPWHVLPKAAAGMEIGALPPTAQVAGAGTLVNQSTLVSGKTQTFDLVEQNPNDFDFTVGDCGSIDLPPGCNISPVDLRDVAVRTLVEADELFVEFAFTLWDKPFRAAQIPVQFNVYIDSDGDLDDDYTVYNADYSQVGTNFDGRNAVFVFNQETFEEETYFFTDSNFNTQNYILRVPAAAIGVSPGEQFGFAVELIETYFTGFDWDCSPRLGLFCGDYHFYTAGQPAFAIPTAQRTLTTNAGTSSNYNYLWSTAAANASPSQIGLLFLHEGATVGRESSSVRLTPPFGRLEVSKRATRNGQPITQAPITQANVGDTITYQVRITNTGALAVNNVAAFDDHLGNLTLGTTTLAPGAFATTSATYTVLSIDLPGPLVNKVTATGRPPAGAPVEAQATVTITLNMPGAALAASVEASASQALLGDRVTYSYRFTNTGSLPLSDLFAHDDKMGGLTLSQTMLAAGQHATATASYFPHLNDLPGPLVNLVTINGTPPVGSLVQATATTTVSLTQPEVGMTVFKHANVASARLSDTITYTYQIANIGTSALTDLAATDDKIGALLVESTLLVPSEIITLTATYTVTAADLPGPLVNVITATAAPPIGTSITVTDSASVLLEGPSRTYLPRVGKQE